MLSNFSCEQTSMMYSHCNEAFQVITIQTAADPGEGRGGGGGGWPPPEHDTGPPPPPPPPLSQGLDPALPGTCHLCRICYIFYLLFLGSKTLSHQVTRILRAFHVSPRSEQTHTCDMLLA